MKYLIKYFKSYAKILKNRNILLLSTHSVLLNFINGFLNWILKIIVYEKGGAFLLGSLYTFERVISSPLTFISGALIDIIGRKPLVIFGSLIMLLALVILPFGLMIPNLLVVAILFYLCAPYILTDARKILLAESVDKSERGKAFSLITFFGRASSAIGAISLSIVTDLMGINEVTGILIILSILLLLVALLLKETASLKRTQESKSKKHIELKLIVKRICAIRRLPLILVSLVGCILTFISTMLSTYLPVYLKDVLEISISLIGTTYFISRILSTITSLIAGKLVDSRGPIFTFLLCLLMIMISLFLMGLFKNSLIAIIGLIVISLSEPLASIAGPVLIVNLTKKEERGTVFGSLGTLSIISSIPAPLLGSLLWGISPHFLILTSSLLVIPNIVILLIIPKVST